MESTPTSPQDVLPQIASSQKALLQKALPQDISQQRVPPQTPRRRWLLLAALSGLALVYTAIYISQMSEAYIDFGDGNYLYIARRLNEGLVLYRDILSPQPPIHVCVGALLLRLGGWLGSPLYTVRIFSMLLHLATMAIVALLALKIFGRVAAAIAAAVLYLLVPIGFWWTLGYQSEPFEMAFLLASTLFFLDFKPRSLVLAGALAAAAPFCNMTAVPFLLFNIAFLLIRRPRLAPYYLAPIAVVGVIVAGVFEWATGAYFQNVFFNQVGTFPKEEILRLSPYGPQTLAQYALSKLASQGLKVLMFDGPWIIWGLAGLALIPKEIAPERPLRSYVAWLTAAGLLSICFVAKGATMDYIFTLGEPILCVVGGGMWAGLFRVPGSEFRVPSCSARGQGSGIRGQESEVRDQGLEVRDQGLEVKGQETAQRDLESGDENSQSAIRNPQSAIANRQSSIVNRQSSILCLALLAVAGVVWFGCYGAGLIVRTLQGEQFEMSLQKIQWVKELTDNNSKPGDAIIAHPYFAFLTGRRLVEEYSEIYIWNIKYGNEMIVDKRPGEGVAKLERMAQAIRERRVPIIFLDMNQTGRHEIIRAALAAGKYELKTKSLRSLNTPFEVWVPGQG
ncbi:MAG: glycosyltransferase family 39 protein [Candidatus Sumerlaeota bacterium]|nr:glycosyltransferase family 39 protein [Candidatus Sumerlaeota bacterium]